MSKKILIDKNGLEFYNNAIYNSYIKPLQDISGIGGDGFNPREEIEIVKQNIGHITGDIKTTKQDITIVKQNLVTTKQDVRGIIEDITTIKQDLQSNDVVVSDMLETVNGLVKRTQNVENTINTLFKEEVLFSGSFNTVGETITLIDDYTKFIDLKIEMDIDGLVCVPFNINNSSKTFIYRDMNLPDNPGKNPNIYVYEVRLKAPSTKTILFDLSTRITIASATHTPTTSTLTVKKITGRRIKK